MGRYVLTLLFLTVPVTWAAGEPCPADDFHAAATVSYVYDGDTVRLSDGRKVRLTGIDTPELGHEGNPGQAFARQARQNLQRLLRPTAKTHLRYDVERRDHHGRMLAHLFLPDGTNLQRAQLEAGLARTLVVPPNVWQQACYAHAEAQARAAGKRLWQTRRYQPVDVAELTPNARGYRIVRGRVQRVGESAKSLWLNLTRQMALRINKQDLGYFSTYSPRGLRGRRVEARGMLKRWRGALRMQIRHPSALTLLD